MGVHHRGLMHHSLLEYILHFSADILHNVISLVEVVYIISTYVTACLFSCFNSIVAVGHPSFQEQYTLPSQHSPQEVTGLQTWMLIIARYNAPRFISSFVSNFGSLSKLAVTVHLNWRIHILPAQDHIVQIPLLLVTDGSPAAQPSSNRQDYLFASILSSPGAIRRLYDIIPNQESCTRG